MTIAFGYLKLQFIHYKCLTRLYILLHNCHFGRNMLEVSNLLCGDYISLSHLQKAVINNFKMFLTFSIQTHKKNYNILI